MYKFLKYSVTLLLIGPSMLQSCSAQQSTIPTSTKLEIKEIDRQSIFLPRLSEPQTQELLNTNNEVTKNYKCRADFSDGNRLAVRLEDGTLFPIRTLSTVKISTDGNRIFNMGFHPMLQGGYIAIEILDRKGNLIKYYSTDLVARWSFYSLGFQKDGTFWIAGLRPKLLHIKYFYKKTPKKKVVLMHFDTNGNLLDEVIAPTYEKLFKIANFAITPDGQYLAVKTNTTKKVKRQVNYVKEKWITEERIIPKYLVFNKKGQLLYQEEMNQNDNSIYFIGNDKFVMFDKGECSVYHIDTTGNVTKKMTTNVRQLLENQMERIVEAVVPLKDGQLAILFLTYTKNKTAQERERHNYELVIVDMKNTKILTQHQFKLLVGWHTHKKMVIKDNRLTVSTKKEKIHFSLIGR